MQNKSDNLSIVNCRLWGMTLLEVLIAIYVFGLGILVILSMITKNISRVHDIKLRSQAVMLAKESIEIVYNRRDTNLDKWLVRNCAVTDSDSEDGCAQYFYTGSVGRQAYAIDWQIDGRYSFSGLSSTGNNWLYYHTWLAEQSDGTDILSGFRYTTSSSGGEVSPFRSYVLFRPVTEYSSHTDKVLHVESHILYTIWSQQRDIVVEWLIGDIR